MPAMTQGSNPVQARLSIIAQLSGRTLDDLYRLFRLEDAPQIADHVGGVPVYNVTECMEWLMPGDPVPVDPATVVNLTPPAV